MFLQQGQVLAILGEPDSVARALLGIGVQPQYASLRQQQQQSAAAEEGKVPFSGAPAATVEGAAAATEKSHANSNLLGQGCQGQMEGDRSAFGSLPPGILAMDSNRRSDLPGARESGPDHFFIGDAIEQEGSEENGPGGTVQPDQHAAMPLLRGAGPLEKGLPSPSGSLYNMRQDWPLGQGLFQGHQDSSSNCEISTVEAISEGASTTTNTTSQSIGGEADEDSGAQESEAFWGQECSENDGEKDGSTTLANTAIPITEDVTVAKPPLRQEPWGKGFTEGETEEEEEKQEEPLKEPLRERKEFPQKLEDLCSTTSQPNGGHPRQPSTDGHGCQGNGCPALGRHTSAKKGRQRAKDMKEENHAAECTKTCFHAPRPPDKCSALSRTQVLAAKALRAWASKGGRFATRMEAMKDLNHAIGNNYFVVLAGMDEMKDRFDSALDNAVIGSELT